QAAAVTLAHLFSRIAKLLSIRSQSPMRRLTATAVQLHSGLKANEPPRSMYRHVNGATASARQVGPHQGNDRSVWLRAALERSRSRRVPYSFSQKFMTTLQATGPSVRDRKRKFR